MLRKTVILLALAAAVPLAGCDDATHPGEPGLMSLLLTDAEGDFTQARVVIERIELVGDDEGEDGGPVVLMDTPFTTDLLTLSNDVATLVEDVTIPAGTYAQLRFVIPDACIGVEQADQSEMIYASDGFDECGVPDGPLQMPSYGSSGLKVILPGGAVEVDGDAHILLLDFDVAESFGRQAGASGMWVLDPTIHAENISLTSSITVDLTVADTVDLDAVGSSLADFEATMAGETEPVAFTDPEDDGVFSATFLHLIPGEYEISVGLQEGVTAYNFTLDPTSPQSVTLGSAEHATLTFEVTSAAPAS
ncbi:MAG TPA: DUF4382 domain-containing protein [Alphaproteobacteria bacterium]|nr:DUF4382 domain-containing protein [Alphaproteobacteria bacterium]